MPAHALSFPEVLEEEYRYFFNDDPFEKVTFARAHVREIHELIRFLETIKKKEELTRWNHLADHFMDALPKDHKPTDNEKETALLAALNGMLDDPALLAHFLNDQCFRDELKDGGELRRRLLSIPQARRLLLESAELKKVVGTDSVVDEFVSRSAAIRVLIARGFRPYFKEYPALLSTIADDEALSKALVDGADADKLRDAVYDVYHWSIKKRLRLWAATTAHGFLSRRIEDVGEWIKTLRDRFAQWIEKLEPEIRDDRPALATNAAALHFCIDANTKRDAHEPPIDAKCLSRFNAILVETAYASKVSNGQTVRALYKAIHKQETAALCLSGGGIRSATFNLGILQGLADHRMLNRFHYLSTVSGGGYIGSWFSSWVRRHQEGAVGVAKDLSRRAVDPLKPEVKPIEHLREYSSYLAPRSSAFSLDSWTLFATYVRNLLLNWTMLLPFLAAVLAVPRILEAYVLKVIRANATANATAWTAAGFVAAAMIVMGAVRPDSETSELSSTPPRKRKEAIGVWIWLTALVVGGFLFCLHWASAQSADADEPLRIIGIFTGCLGSGTLVYTIRRFYRRPKKNVTDAILGLLAGLREILLTLLAGLLGGGLLYLVFKHAFSREKIVASPEIYACLGMPLFLFLCFVAGTLLVGFTTISMKDYDREWWARAAAALFLYCTVHMLGAAAVLLLPPLALVVLLPVGGVSGVTSYLLSRKLKTSKLKEVAASRWLLPLMRVTAGLTMLVVAVTIAVATTYLLQAINDALPTQPTNWLTVQLQPKADPDLPQLFIGKKLAPAASLYFQELRRTALLTLYLLVASLAAVAAAMSRFLNVNAYSMHAMYRNRLIRAYLGASRWFRRPDLFTGFDPRDNVKMWELRPEALWWSSFVDFYAFATEIMKEEKQKIWNQLSGRTRRKVNEYVSAATSAERAKLRDLVSAMVVDELNELMRTTDIRNGVRVPVPSTDLLIENRQYLAAEFPTTLKDFPKEQSLPRAPQEVQIVRRTVPKEFRDAERKNVRARPPLHILNVALNLVRGRNLAWQERKASSFTISPLHCGSGILGYRDSAEYSDGISLGTAMAISGAAVSPNMGALSSPTFTFMMTLLNARLGWWLGNPKKNAYRAKSPGGSIGALLREALGMTDESGSFVFLSDGGHFENLGLYEMVMRRCKYIIVCDATADSGYAFADLANAVRKIRIDLGVSIEPLDTRYIGPQKDEKYGRYCAFGEIRYHNVDGDDSTKANREIGYLLYIKPSVYSDCPPDVRNYRNQSATFPHESTADQFFNETQFESYRALGRHMIGRICGDKPDDISPHVVPNIATFFGLAHMYTTGKKPPQGDTPVQTMNDVVSWMTESLG